MKSLLNKNAIVTGGSKGIGKSVCLALANAGANVFLLDIDEKNGSKTVKEILTTNKNSSFYKINVSEEDEWKEFSNFLKCRSIFFLISSFSF